MNFEPLLPHRFKLGESVLWSDAAQALFLVDILEFGVHRLAWRDLGHTVWPVPSEPGALALSEDGSLLVGLRDGLARLDTATGALTQLADAPYDTAHMRFNDGACDARGRFWTGTMDRSRTRFCAGLWAWDQGLLRQGPQGVMVSNGLAFSRDGTCVYQADSALNVIYRYPYDVATGTPGAREVWFATDPEDGVPDGAAVDADGHYWIAMHGGGCLLRLSPDGRICRRVPLPVRTPTMVAFAGPGLDCIVVTTSGNETTADDHARSPLAGRVLVARDTLHRGLPAPTVPALAAVASSEV